MISGFDYNHCFYGEFFMAGDSSSPKNEETEKVIYPDFIYSDVDSKEEINEEKLEEEESFADKHIYSRLMFFLPLVLTFLFWIGVFVRTVFLTLKALVYFFQDRSFNLAALESFLTLGKTFLFVVILFIGVISPTFPLRFIQK